MLKQGKNCICSKCGHEATEGEIFVTQVDPNTEWWKTLMEEPSYCQKCAFEQSPAPKGKE